MDSSANTTILPLRCSVQSYAWGKIGMDSAVGQLKTNDANFTVESDKPYAELWMGTHPNGPSMVITPEGDIPLLEYLQRNSEKAGSKLDNLPYLFKVLSVNKALSIQAHPDLQLAKQLHNDRPTVYKDANHKPEMAIALTDFEALCQFRDGAEIAKNLSEVEEFKGLVDPQVIAAFQASPTKSELKDFFTAFINSKEQDIKIQVDALNERLCRKKDEIGTLPDVDALVLRLIGQYSHDIGVFCPYLLNYITLKPGEAIFLGANEPHAYLDGNCVECMACSDNVVRAGLTPKFIDKETLCDMLTYSCGGPSVQNGQSIAKYVKRYTPGPVDEFEVDHVELPAGGSCDIARTTTSASIFIVIEGCGEETRNEQSKLKAGDVFFQPVNTELSLKAGDAGLKLFRAHAKEPVVM